MSANDELQAHTCEKVVEEYENIKQTVIKCGYGNCPFTDEFCASGDCPYDPDNSVNTDKTITVEKEVYEAVLRNSLRVNELEEENLQLKQKVTSRNKRLQKYKKLKGELATLASNRNILIKRLKEENQQLKEILKECKQRFETYKRVKSCEEYIIYDLEYLTSKIDEVLK